jgi:hypothetical protein
MSNSVVDGLIGMATAEDDELKMVAVYRSGTTQGLVALVTADGIDHVA